MDSTDQTNIDDKHKALKVGGMRVSRGKPPQHEQETNKNSGIESLLQSVERNIKNPGQMVESMKDTIAHVLNVNEEEQAKGDTTQEKKDKQALTKTEHPELVR